MQANKIVIGETYEVEVDGLELPRKLTGTGGGFVPEHAFTTRGVSKKYGDRALAKVIGHGDLVYSSGSWKRYYQLRSNGGYLVEFVEPYQVRSYEKVKPVAKTAVLDSRHILRLKSEVDAEKAAQVEWQTKHDADTLEKFQAFEPKIVYAISLLKALGLNPVESGGSYSGGIQFDGGTLGFRMTRYSGNNGINVPVGWHPNSTVNTEAIIALLDRVGVS